MPADRYAPDLPSQWGRTALDLVAEHGGMAAVCAELGMADDLTAQVADRVVAKLTTSPIEDLRLDFEDGYGDRGEATEDADSIAAAAAVAAAVSGGVSPAFIGIRFKCFEAPTRRRGIRTLDLFLGGLLERLGELPPGLVLTFPKVSTVSQVEAMVATCRALESAYGLADRALGFEIQVETPSSSSGPTGRPRSLRRSTPGTTG